MIIIMEPSNINRVELVAVCGALTFVTTGLLTMSSLLGFDGETSTATSEVNFETRC